MEGEVRHRVKGARHLVKLTDIVLSHTYGIHAYYSD